MGGVGECNEKSGKLVEICTTFEELIEVWEHHKILSPKIVVLGCGNSLKLGGKFPKKWIWGDYNKRRESKRMFFLLRIKTGAFHTITT